MNRAKWKGSFLKTNNRNFLSWNSELNPNLKNSIIKIYDGKTNKTVTVINEMFFHKTGEFCKTWHNFTFKKSDGNKAKQ